jgi:hypothetical protein
LKPDHLPIANALNLEESMPSAREKMMSILRPFSVATALTILLLSPQASATVVSASGTVIQINTYGDFGSGDFIFRLSSYVTGCEAGFWISPSQPGFKTLVAAVLQARATGETIAVGGNDALIWNGSASKYCKIDWFAMS